MSHRRLSLTAAALGLSFLASAALASGCSSCPDLAYRAFEFDIQGGDPSLIIMTVTDPATGATPCDQIALSENCRPPAGKYDLSFTVSGAAVGSLTEVCTLGELSGCAAEDAEAKGAPAQIRLLRDGTGWTITLERQGVCPAG